MPSRANRRKLRNYLLRPSLQLRYVVYFAGFSFIAAVLNQMLLVRSLQVVLLDAIARDSFEPLALATNIGGALSLLGWQVALLFPLLALTCALFAVRVTHRLVGPQVAFHRQIEALRQGDYSARCTLRRDDEFQDLADALNDLAATLASRQRAGDERKAESRLVA